MFDDITNDGDRRRTIDDGAKTEDMFVADDYLFDDDDGQETKNLCNYVPDDVDQNYPSPLESLPIFSDVLLPKNKKRE